MEIKRKKIAFGCAGEGRGHAARTIALGELLAERYEIIVFAPSTVCGFIEESLPAAEIIEIPPVSFHKEGHTIKYGKTIVRNLPLIFDISSEVDKLMRLITGMGISAIISDFEPFTAIAGANLNLPVLQLNHPGIVLRYFSLKPDALAAKLAAKIMMQNGSKELLCSFYGGDIGPIIRKEVKKKITSRGDYYLVYTKAESRQQIAEALKSFPDEIFLIFPNPELDFTEALAGCKGVISSSGHQMLSEALYLRKPILAFPQKMQFEQRLNSIMLEKSGRGLAGDIRKAVKSIDSFISRIDDFPLLPAVNENFLFTDFTVLAADLIYKFIENNGVEKAPAVQKFFPSLKSRPGRMEPA